MMGTFHRHCLTGPWVAHPTVFGNSLALMITYDVVFENYTCHTDRCTLIEKSTVICPISCAL